MVAGKPATFTPEIDMKKTELSDRDKLIIELWEKEYTGEQIAKELCVTRNTVMGRLARFRKQGLVAYKMNAKIALKDVKSKSLKRIKIFNAHPRMFRGRLPPTPLPELPPIKDKPVKFMDLTPFSCRFIVNEGKASEFLFCGKPKMIRSYCEDHAKLCYLPPKVKEIENGR